MNIASTKSAFFLMSLFGLSVLVAFAQKTPDLVDVRQYGARAVNAW
jgi:lipid-A-disaccharide synthase-like uncharacterized protein